MSSSHYVTQSLDEARQYQQTAGDYLIPPDCRPATGTTAPTWLRPGQRFVD
jgi:hypothetical protein